MKFRVSAEATTWNEAAGNGSASASATRKVARCATRWPCAWRICAAAGSIAITAEGEQVSTTIPVKIGGRPLRVGAILAAAFLAEIVWALTRVARAPIAGGEAVASTVQSVRQIGIAIFTTHAFAFEVTSILILVAMVGAVALAKRNL